MQRGLFRRVLVHCLLATAFVVLLCDYLQRHYRTFGPAPSLIHGFARLVRRTNLPKLPEEPQLLKFQVCNGFANQRLSLVYGLVLAALTNRTAVLPDMIPSGVQYTTANIFAGSANSYSFDTMYNSEHFILRMSKSRLPLMRRQQAAKIGNFTFVSLNKISDAFQLLRDVHRYTPRVTVDCPLFKVPTSSMLEQEDLVWAILGALSPSADIMAHVRTAVNKLGAMSSSGQYNFVHLRAERDWVLHCQRWSTIPDGVVRDNCMNNTETVDTILKSKNFKTKTPLYVATYWTDVEYEVSLRIMARLQAAGYRVYTQKDILTGIGLLPRETIATVEFYVALQSQRFIGNSVSTFSAMLIYERRHAGQWAAYYNGGNIPLAQVLPLDKLPWVFTYNDKSEGYDYMLKAALQSALRWGGLKPYCLFSGAQDSDIYNYLLSNNVVVMQHQHEWAEELISKAKPFMQQNMKHSHLYGSATSLVGTFQRIDIPILPELDQYDFVFFSDADAFFTKRFTLADFGTPLPKSLGMTYEMVDMFPFNAGIMLMNIQELRSSYRDFLDFILSNRQGMYFEGYGPGDQGAYNQFYEESVRAGKISQDFNAKPYHPLRDNALIVHFHGPKPGDYLTFADTGECGFGSMCKEGFQNSLCNYIEAWFPNISDDAQARRLYRVCKVMQLYSPSNSFDRSAVSTVASYTSYDFATFSEAAI